MAVRIRRARESDYPEMLRADERTFGFTTTEAQSDAIRTLLDLDRFRVAVDAGRIVGIAGSFEMELTVPGPRSLSTGGVTWVSVAPTHRRRGLLRRLMGAVHDDIDARGEVVGALIATEGGIYERFGYGTATLQRNIEIDRRLTQIAPQFVPSIDDVRLVTPSDHVEEMAAIFERYRGVRVGEMTRSEDVMRLDVQSVGSSLCAAIHPDGFVTWTIKKEWSSGLPAYEVWIEDFVAVTPEAHVALWHLMLSIDLAGPIRSVRAAAPDDPLPYLLTEPRALRTTNLGDRLMVCPRRIGEFLAGRTYGTDDAFVLEVGFEDDRSERWRVAGSPDGASAKRVRTRPDLTLTRAALGAIGLGGVRPSELARGRRLDGRDADVVRRADHFFGTAPLPWLTTHF